MLVDENYICTGEISIANVSVVNLRLICDPGVTLSELLVKEYRHNTSTPTN